MSREMKDSGLDWAGKVPAHWTTIRLKDIATGESGLFMDGDWIESNIISDDGIRYLTTGNIGNGYYKEQGNGFVRADIVKSMNCLIAKPGDIVISRLNKPIARACLLPDSNDEYVIAVDNVVLRNGSKQWNKEFLIYAMNIDGYNEEANMRARGATMPRISRTMLGSLQTVYPPYIEQNRIVHYLNPKVKPLNLIIEKTKSTIEDYKLLKQTIITEAVTKGLDKNVKMKECGLMGVDKIPTKWGVVSLKRISHIRYGLGQPPAPSDTGLPIIRATNVDAGKITEDNMIYAEVKNIKTSKDVILLEGDLIVVRSGAYTGDIGYIDEKWAGSLAGYDMIVSVKKNNSKFIMYSFLSTYVLDNQIFLMRMRAAQPHLNAEELGSVKVISPPYSEQNKIVSYLNQKCFELDSIISQKLKLVEEIENYKKSLIYEYVTGKKEVK